MFLVKMKWLRPHRFHSWKVNLVATETMSVFGQVVEAEISLP